MRRRQRARPLPVDGSYLSPATPRVLAHRGLAIEAPENTMLAFLKALSVGVEYLETDVHVSQDGVAVIAHDADLIRVAGRAVRVDQLTMAELRRINLGNGQGFCSLAEVLDAFPSARFNIDIKADSALAPAVEAIRAAGAIDRVLIASFNDRRRRAAVQQLPGVATSASLRASTVAFIALRLKLRFLARMALRDVDAVQLPERLRGVRVVTPTLVASMHSLGVEVHVWTVNDAASMARLLGFGVDGLVTDRSDLAMDLIRSA